MADPWAAFPIAEPVKPAAGEWDAFPLADSGEAPPLTIKKGRAREVAEDVAKSGAVGVAKGAIGVATLPRAISDLADYGPAWLMAKAAEKFGLMPPGKTANDLLSDAAAIGKKVPRSKFDLPSAQEVQGAIEGATGPFYKPQTTPGKYAQTIGEFLPGALAMGGATAGNALRYGVAPAIASEAAGQATEGTSAEPWARVGAALGAGGLASLSARPNASQSALTRHAQGVTPQQVDAAEALFQEAQRMGVPLTRANALDAVTQGATNMSGLQRVVEGSGKLKGFFAPTESGVASAGRQTFDAIAPMPGNPSNIGPTIGKAAQETVGDVQAAINRATRPLYKAAEPVQVGRPVQNALAGDPVYAQALREVRADPALNATIANLSDDAVGVIDLVQRRLRERAASARMPGQADSSNLRAANFEDARTAPLAAAEQATGGPAGSYALARDTQAALRQKYLEPLMSGPLGKLQSDPTTKQAIEALFPSNPVAGSAGEIVDAVSALAARRPQAARELVRAHLEGAFNEATQRIQAGPNQWGGASFVAAVKGNRQQAENLSAAISALPQGDQILKGVDRLFSVLEATAYRQHIGSQTAFNAETLAMLKQAGISAEALKIASGGGLKLPQKVMDSFERWRLGANTESLAKLITDPQGGALFKQLATASIGSRQFLGVAGQLGALGFRAHDSAAR